MKITESQLKRIIRNVISETSGHYKVGDHRMSQLASARRSSPSDDSVLPYTHSDILERLVNDCELHGCDVSEVQITQAIARHASRFYHNVLEDLKRY